MCGITGIFGPSWSAGNIQQMVKQQAYRGPDAGRWHQVTAQGSLGHNRLSIIDLSKAGNQPMSNQRGDLSIVYNGEIYNYLELRAELNDYPYQNQTDTEVILAAYERWGEACLDRFIGMFAFILWDSRKQKLFAARDRFGVKPLYYHQKRDGTLLLSSEIKTLHAVGCPAKPNHSTWATYLTYGLYEHQSETFWEEVYALAPGHCLTWEQGKLDIRCWYDLAERVGDEIDQRPTAVVQEEYLSLLKECVSLRFRADVPIGINISGGADSSILLGIILALQLPASEVNAFTFATGDKRYDEVMWAKQMVQLTEHPHHIPLLQAKDVPILAEKVQYHQDEPFGGLPTLAYSQIFKQAREMGVVVLLDGQGMDEQWAGYDYYARALQSQSSTTPTLGPVQGSKSRATRPECLTPEFRQLAKPMMAPQPFSDPLRNMQYRDARYTKIPRALRFNDRISMMYSTELREPFLDHRLFELALCQPVERKIQGSTHKWLLRQIGRDLLPESVVTAPKRPLQTPQREWLRTELKSWTQQMINIATDHFGKDWLDKTQIDSEWQAYQQGESDNSFYIWQWVTIGLMVNNHQLRS